MKILLSCGMEKEDTKIDDIKSVKKTNPKSALKPNSQIGFTVTDIQKALDEWNQIPEDAISEMEQMKSKTRELIEQLNEQIKEFGL
jgi:hypothetical protein